MSGRLCCYKQQQHSTLIVQFVFKVSASRFFSKTLQENTGKGQWNKKWNFTSWELFLSPCMVSVQPVSTVPILLLALHR